MKVLVISTGLLALLALAGQVCQANDASNTNTLSKYQSLSGNFIEHSTGKSRMEVEKRMQDLLNPKTIFKVAMKILFGNPDEVTANSRTVLGMISQMLAIVKKSFGQRGRSGTARTYRDAAEDVASAGVSLLQGYVKSVMTNDDSCKQRYLCQASYEAARDAKDIGYIMASVAGYASSQFLHNPKSTNFTTLFNATKAGKMSNQNCSQIYPNCSEP